MQSEASFVVTSGCDMKIRTGASMERFLEETTLVTLKHFWYRKNKKVRVSNDMLVMINAYPQPPVSQIILTATKL